jgi:glycosyltransferase involved in cell wall biosynthesis
MGTGIFVACVGRQHAGPEIYERNLVSSIAAIDRENEYEIFCLGQRAVDQFQIQQDNFRFHAVAPSNRWFGIPFGVPASLIRHSIKLYHATFVPPPISPAEYIFTQHDISPYVKPEFYPGVLGLRLRWLIRVALEKARFIICISQHAKDSTAEMFGIPEERMSVVHHGVDPRFRPLDRNEARKHVKLEYGVEGPFVLYVGKLESRKNIVRLIEAFGEFAKANGDDWTLVLAGRRFWGTDGIDTAVARHKLKDKVIEIGYIDHDNLPSLYSAAEIFVFPTLWEGFGLPLLEAMACGAPTVASRVSCFPEIAGDGAVLIDPYRVDEIAGAMLELANDSEAREALSQRAVARASNFTWEATARKTIAVYKDAGDLS